MLDLKAQFGPLREDVERAIGRVLDSQAFINGPEVGELEAKAAEYAGCRFAVGVSSGTDALLAALMSLDIGPGDEVVTTPYTFFATAGSIWRVGARPVFIDIEPDTFNLDAGRIEAVLTERTKAIMPVHLFGQTADMEAINDIADRYGLHVVEDAAQALGARQGNQPAGSLGAVGCFSFFPSKNLGALGDGGLVTTQDEALADRLKQCRNHGSKPKYFHKWVGGNFRLDTLQAAALLVKLDHLETWHEGRIANAAKYDERFRGVDEIVRPVVRPGRRGIYNQYVIRVPRRDSLVAHLRKCGIGCAIYYPLSLHEQECFADLGHSRGDFPESERAARETVAIPVYPELTDDQIDYVAATVTAFVAGRV
jgi:dTDP-4-amino-4,6-dideoxygalactose transaminase